MQRQNEKLVFLGRLTAGVAVMVTVAWIAGLVRELWPIGPDSYALDVDFSVYWAAARLALEGAPLAPFDPTTLEEARNLAPGTETAPMLWLYPPAWMTLVLPLGALPFFWSWLLYVGVSLALFAWATRGPSRAIPGLWPILLASPAVLLTMALGQNSILFGAIFVGAMEAMRRERVILAGALIAAMTMKPQLGLAIPFILMASGQWRVMGWAIVWTALLIAVSAIWPGLDYWPHFIGALGDTAELVRDTILPRMMLTAYALATVLGASHETALAIHMGVALVLVALLSWLWSTRVSFDLKVAALALATISVTPYAIYYEMVFAMVALLYLARGRALASTWMQLLAGIVWIAPVVGILSLSGPGFAPMVPVLLFLLGITCARARPQTVLGEP